MKISKSKYDYNKELAKKRAIARLKQIKEQKVSIIADIYLKKVKENNINNLHKSLILWYNLCR